MSRPINCDQVSWMLGAIRRHITPTPAPAASRATEMQAYALLYELMEVAGLHFEDDAAAHNATPRDVFMLRPKAATTGGACQAANISGGAKAMSQYVNQAMYRAASAIGEQT